MPRFTPKYNTSSSLLECPIGRVHYPNITIEVDPCLRLVFRNVRLVFHNVSLVFRNVSLVFSNVRLVFRNVRLVFCNVRLVFRNVRLVFCNVWLVFLKFLVILQRMDQLTLSTYTLRHVSLLTFAHTQDNNNK